MTTGLGNFFNKEYVSHVKGKIKELAFLHNQQNAIKVKSRPLQNDPKFINWPTDLKLKSINQLSNVKVCIKWKVFLYKVFLISVFVFNAL